MVAAAYAQPVKPRSRPPAMIDVAALAGVSYQTVSRVVNRHPSVAQATRRRVQDAIAHLEYQPNGAARALVTGRGSTVAVFTGNTTLYGAAGMLEGIEDGATAAGLSVTITVLRDETAEAVARICRRVLAQPLAGTVSLTQDSVGRLALAAVPASVPSVGVGGSPVSERALAVVDERAGAAEATRHLLSLGHRTVHHVAIPHESRPGDRSTGWREALVQAGRRVPAVVQATWSARSGYDAGVVLARRRGVTAVLCGNDELAVGVVRALFDSGRRVPEDVSVVGFDDQPLAAFTRPALTTVRQDFPELGREAMTLLRLQIDGGTAVGTSVARAELVIRESTAPPP